MGGKNRCWLPFGIAAAVAGCAAQPVNDDAPEISGETQALSRAAGGFSAQTFQALDANNVVVLGSDGKLWYEHAPFGSLPPARTQIDSNVASFQVAGTVANGVYVLSTDGHLWKESPNGQVPPPRMAVDGNVRSFEWAADGTGVFVLGTDGNLWLESPNGSVPPPRAQVDTNVKAFQLIDGKHVVVLTEDAQLWMDAAPYGSMPAHRSPIEANVRAFQPLATDSIVVLGNDGNLWLEKPNGSVPSPRTLVDGNAASFQAVNAANIFVLHPDGGLWWEMPLSTGPVTAQVDGNVTAFNALDQNNLMVLGGDHNLWFEHGPFGTVPPKRELVDGNVAAPRCADVAISSLTARPLSSMVLSVNYVNPRSVPVLVRVTNTSDGTSQSFSPPAGAPGSVNFPVSASASYKVEVGPVSDSSCTVSVVVSTPANAPSFAEGITLEAPPSHSPYEAIDSFYVRSQAILQHLACKPEAFSAYDRQGSLNPNYPGDQWSAEALAMMAYQGDCPSTTWENRRNQVQLALLNFSSNGRFLGTDLVGEKGDLDMALKDLMPILLHYRSSISDASYRHMLAYLASLFTNSDATPDNLAPPGIWAVRTSYDSVVFEGVDTTVTESENHRMMIHSDEYLACQMLFAETHDARYDVTQNGLRDIVLNRMASILRHDFKEYNSKVYSKFSLSAIENLEEFAQDADVRTATQAVLDFAAAKYASSASLMRREAPFRRRLEYDENDFFADPADHNKEPSIDDMACRFALYAGTTDLLPVYVKGGVPGGDLGTFLPDGCKLISRQAMGSYRVPPMILALAQDKAHQKYFQTFAGQGNSDETSTSFNNVETYDNEGPFLIAGGGVPAESGSTALDHQSTAEKDIGFPVPAVVLPNRTYPNILDPRNVRNRAKTVYILSRLCMAPGFACGHYPTVPDEFKPFSLEYNLSGAQVSTDGDWNHRAGWKFVDYETFYVVVYTNLSSNLPYGFIEAMPASEFPSIADLAAKTIAANPGMKAAGYAPDAGILEVYYTSPRGGSITAVHYPMAGAHDSSRPYPVSEDRGLPLPSTNTWSWGLASGIINAGTDGRVTINALGPEWTNCVLDLTDPQHPARIGCDTPAPSPSPTLTSISPNTGTNAGGTLAIIHGTGFNQLPGATRFLFGSNAATNVNCTSRTTCTVTVPGNLGASVAQTVPVTVLSGGHVAGGVSYTYTAGPACRSTQVCIGSSTPELTISCPSTVSFYTGPNYNSAQSGTTFSEMTSLPGSAGVGVQACFGDNRTTSCTFFSGTAALSCKATPPPETCNGRKKPAPCQGTWRCCGDDGWRCGNCL